jgi:hypothetical protein
VLNELPYKLHKYIYINIYIYIYSRAPVCTDSVSAVHRGPPKNENERNERFIRYKTHAKRERVVTWWNPTVLVSSKFVPVPTLPRITCLHSASSVLAVRISCHVIIVVSVLRKPLFISTTFQNFPSVSGLLPEASKFQYHINLYSKYSIWLVSYSVPSQFCQ